MPAFVPAYAPMTTLDAPAPPTDVILQTKPTQAGPVKIAAFSDTCGNLIQIYQPTS